MHFLIGLLLGLATLYFWLSAHWFARVVVFLALTVILFFGIGLTYNQTVPGGVGLDGFFLELLISATVAWFISSIPIYLQRARSGHYQQLPNYPPPPNYPPTPSYQPPPSYAPPLRRPPRSTP
jgi:hypothetical protein